MLFILEADFSRKPSPSVSSNTSKNSSSRPCFLARRTLDEVIDRVVGRAVDYETNESEYDEYIDDETFEYFENLYDIANLISSV